MPDDQKGEQSSSGGPVSPDETPHVSHEQTTDNSSSYNYYDESYTYDSANQPAAAPLAPVTLTPPPPPPSAAYSS